MTWLLLYLSRGVFLYSCFGSDGYTSNGLLLEALFSRHRIAPLLRLWWNLFLQLIPYSYLHKLMPWYFLRVKVLFVIQHCWTKEDWILTVSFCPQGQLLIYTLLVYLHIGPCWKWGQCWWDDSDSLSKKILRDRGTLFLCREPTSPAAYINGARLDKDWTYLNFLDFVLRLYKSETNLWKVKEKIQNNI